jgi:hypothetical protein
MTARPTGGRTGDGRHIQSRYPTPNPLSLLRSGWPPISGARGADGSTSRVPPPFSATVPIFAEEGRDDERVVRSVRRGEIRPRGRTPPLRLGYDSGGRPTTGRKWIGRRNHRPIPRHCFLTPAMGVCIVKSIYVYCCHLHRSEGGLHRSLGLPRSTDPGRRRPNDAPRTGRSNAPSGFRFPPEGSTRPRPRIVRRSARHGSLSERSSSSTRAVLPDRLRPPYRDSYTNSEPYDISHEAVRRSRSRSPPDRCSR